MCVDWEYSDTRFFIANPHKKTAEAIQTSRHHHRKFGIFAGYLRGDIHIDQRSNKTTPNRFLGLFTMMNMNQNQNQHGSNMTDTFSQFFSKNALTSEGLEAAGRFTKEKAMELKAQAQEGDRSLRFLAFIGGIACILVALLELPSKIMGFQFVGAVIDLYIIMLGSVVVILEGKNFFLSETFVQNLHKYALFLKFLWGRGSLYFICGTLQLVQIDLFNLIAGKLKIKRIKYD